MVQTAYLTLENGKVFKGRSFGSIGDTTGEIVFTTGMSGYAETLTDPSYFGQIILQTFPLIGNYGIIPDDFESCKIHAKGYIVKEPCAVPSNFRSAADIDSFLRERGVVGICGIDTRALTRIIRENGVMNGKISCEPPEESVGDEIRSYRIKNAVENVSLKSREFYRASNGARTIALLDFGYKRNIREELIKRGCDVWVFPHDTDAETIMSVKPDGIMLTNGPGDPAENTKVISAVRALTERNVPIFGICLGHQILALASGFKTVRLKYGHRGANQPVNCLSDGRVYVTSQNHGYAVLSDSIDGRKADEWFTNANDKTCEGIIYKGFPAFSVQFHPEACGGPLDTAFLFDRFIKLTDAKTK